PHAEDEAAWPALVQGPPPTRHRLGVTSPDVGDSARDDQAVRGREQDRAMGEGFPGQGLPVPERPIAELLDLADHLALDRCRLHGKGAEPHADAAGPDGTEAFDAHPSERLPVGRGGYFADGTVSNGGLAPALEKA